MKKRIVRFVGMRFEHHSRHSGYDLVADRDYSEYETATIEVPKLVDISGSFYGQGERMRHRIALDVASRLAYRSAEVKTAVNLLKMSDALYHVLYGEQVYKYLGKFAGVRQNKLIATFHLPPAQFKQKETLESRLGKLSAIVCVGSNQLDFFSNILGEDRIFYVPLGIDTDYFCPPTNKTERETNLCLCVGGLYRDFPTLRGVIELVAYRRPDTVFVVVTPEKNWRLVGDHPNVEFRFGIPESELRHLYQTASLLVMPFYDGTANIAVTEALACGLPIVSTDIGAIRDYVGERSAVLLPSGDARAMADTVVNLLDDPETRLTMSTEARNRALVFSWPKMTKKLEQVYDRVFEADL